MIALTPSLVETVLDLQNNTNPDAYHLIAVSKYTSDPRAGHLIKLDTVGSLETITSLRPALVLLHSSDIILADKLKALSIPVMQYDMDTFDGIETAIAQIGQKIHQSDRAQYLIDHMKQERLKLRQMFHDKSPESKRILVIVDRLDARMQQFYISQRPAYLADIVEDCGFQVIVIKDQNNAWVRMESESLIALNPDFMVYFARDKSDAEEIRRSFESLYPALSAIKNQRFLVYDNPEITVPGPGIVDRAYDLCQALNRLK